MIVPSSQSEQTLESLAALVGVQNGFPTWSIIASELFGRPQTPPNQPFHPNIQRCFTKLSGAGYDSASQLIERHSYLSLFKPFVDEQVYRAANQKVLYGPIAGLDALLSLRVSATFHAELHFCGHCVDEEFSTLNYAFAHRAHQVAGVEYCHRHYTALRPLGLDRNYGPAKHGLILSAEFAEGLARTRCRNQPTTGAEFWSHRYAKWVQAVFDGAVPVVPTIARSRVMVARLASTRPDRRKPFNQLLQLEQLVVDRFGPWLPRNFDLSIRSNPHSRWSALVLREAGDRSPAVTTLLALTVLFDDPNDYRAAVLSSSPLADGEWLHDYVRNTKARSTSVAFEVERLLMGLGMGQLPTSSVESRKAAVTRRLNPVRVGVSRDAEE